MSSFVLPPIYHPLYELIIACQNYDFPNNCEDYIHRIGRTGVCIAFYHLFDKSQCYFLARWNDWYLLHLLHY